MHPTFPPKEQHSKKRLKSDNVAYNALHLVVLQDTLLQNFKNEKKLNSFHHTGSFPFPAVDILPQAAALLISYAENASLY